MIIRHTVKTLLLILFLFQLPFIKTLGTHSCSADTIVKSQNSTTSSIDSESKENHHHHKKIKEIVATGEHSRSLLDHKPKGSVSSWDRYKMKLSFWPRKVVTFLELGLVIIFGIFIGQILEEIGIIKFLGFITWPISKLGRLPNTTSPAFIFALQSGAIANSMLVTQRDNGQLTKRELYTSVFVVSSVSLIAHLPTFIVPLGMAFGWKAATFYFGVRFSAIVVQVASILFVSSTFFYKKNDTAITIGITGEKIPAKPEKMKPGKSTPFFRRVWKKSEKSILRLLIYLLPTFFVTALLEKSGFFEWLGLAIANVPLISWLPAQAAAVIAAQAINLYNGAIMAASFVDSGAISIRDSILILLTGTLVTAPIRTLKHSLGSYVAILGARPGMIMAFATQFTRSFFLLLFIIGCALIWR
jgi:hypothetical protein